MHEGTKKTPSSPLVLNELAHSVSFHSPPLSLSPCILFIHEICKKQNAWPLQCFPTLIRI